MMMSESRPAPESFDPVMPLEIEIDLSEETSPMSEPVFTQPLGQEAGHAISQSTGLFPVDFAIENLNFIENSFDEIELVSPDQKAAKIQIDQEDLNSIENIPKKMAFKIGEVADMVGVKQYVLRYWESEFDQLNPKKSKYNQRVYTRKDVENALLIKKLLYKDRFSIEGARSALKQLKETVKEERAVRVVHQNQEHAIELVEDLLAHIRKSKLTI
jgi:DNA-binding transcriptional MerR regulator